MNQFFAGYVLQPIIEFLTKKAKELQGGTTELEKIEAFVITELDSFLTSFTHATTTPGDFMHMNMDAIKSMIASSAKPTEQKPLP